jgi:tRNA(Met) cytidine acetyltransferase
MRWSRLDEVEPAIEKALLLNNSLVKISQETIDLNKVSIELIEAKNLKCDEQQLKQVFSLLSLAHYQTRPSDLQFLLNDNKSINLILRYKETVLGVALINIEGNLETETCIDILNAKKRLKGELLPQSIISNFGLDDAGMLSYFRIMRIAIHPQIQNSGLGSKLITHIIQLAKDKNVDFIGASFSANEKTTYFWHKNQFQCYRIASSINPASGGFGVEMIKSISRQSEKILSNIITEFNSNLIYNISFFFQEMDNKTLSRILVNHIIHGNDYPSLSNYEKNQLMRFIGSQLAFPMVANIIKKLFLSKIDKIIEYETWDDQSIEFLVANLLKQKSLKELAISFNLNGKKASTDKLKTLVEKLLVTQ